MAVPIGSPSPLSAFAANYQAYRATSCKNSGVETSPENLTKISEIVKTNLKVLGSLVGDKKLRFQDDGTITEDMQYSLTRAIRGYMQEVVLPGLLPDDFQLKNLTIFVNFVAEFYKFNRPTGSREDLQNLEGDIEKAIGGLTNLKEQYLSVPEKLSQVETAIKTVKEAKTSIFHYEKSFDGDMAMSYIDRRKNAKSFSEILSTEGFKQFIKTYTHLRNNISNQQSFREIFSTTFSNVKIETDSSLNKFLTLTENLRLNPHQSLLFVIEYLDKEKKDPSTFVEGSKADQAIDKALSRIGHIGSHNDDEINTRLILQETFPYACAQQLLENFEEAERSVSEPKGGSPNVVERLKNLGALAIPIALQIGFSPTWASLASKTIQLGVGDQAISLLNSLLAYYKGENLNQKPPLGIKELEGESRKILTALLQPPK